MTATVVFIAEYKQRNVPLPTETELNLPGAVVSSYKRSDGARCASLQIRRADGVLQTGFESPAFRDWENAVRISPQRKCRWLRNGAVLREVGPFDVIAEKLAEQLQFYAPHVSFLVDEYIGGW